MQIIIASREAAEKEVMVMMLLAVVMVPSPSFFGSLFYTSRALKVQGIKRPR